MEITITQKVIEESRIGRAVSYFTPLNCESVWTEFAVNYLAPLTSFFTSCQMSKMEMAVIPRNSTPGEDGSKGAQLAEGEWSWGVTALIVASYILSLGILPLLAAIVNVFVRCNQPFHWSASVPGEEFIRIVTDLWIPQSVTDIGSV